MWSWMRSWSRAMHQRQCRSAKARRPVEMGYQSPPLLPVPECALLVDNFRNQDPDGPASRCKRHHLQSTDIQITRSLITVLEPAPYALQTHLGYGGGGRGL